MGTIKFKTDKERRAFLDGYRRWQILCRIPDLDVLIYAAHLSNGAVIYATEYKFLNYENVLRYEVVYSLVLPDDDESFGTSKFYRYYSPRGYGITTIMRYLKINKDCEVMPNDLLFKK